MNFDRDTAVRPLGNGRYESVMSTGWWIVRGPNGGYVAAVVLRALTEAVADSRRAPRSLTIHFTAPPLAGPVVIATQLERVGRSLTFVSGRMYQDDRLLALALGAFSTPWESDIEIHHARMPDVASPEATQTLPGRPSGTLPMHARYEYRWALGGAPFSSAEVAELGGWIRFAEPRVVDAPAAAAIADAWPPTLMPLLAADAKITGFPTVDLTVHFRTRLPIAGAAPGDWTLAVFRAREVREGFFEEDGELWSRDGQLLAHSRQLAIVM